MQNVFIIGDLHLRAVPPISRKDNYPIVILEKLEYLASIAANYRCKTFILLGDVFDSPSTSLQYLAAVINAFKRISEKGISVYTIVGNHDIKNNRMDSLYSTALGILVSTNYVKLAPTNLNIENTIFRCFNYPEEITKKNSDEYEVCIAHRYYEFNLDNESLRKEDLINLNYDAMVLGHLHAPCETLEIGNTLLYRPGSLSRNASEPFNKTRMPRVLVFNCTNHKAAYLEVSCSNPADIFIENIEANNQSTLSMRDLINFITTAYSSSDMNIREYFTSLKIPLDCKIKIAKYLDAIGA